MNPPRLIFMGTPDFAVPSLEALLREGFLPVAVVTGEDKPRGRGQEVTPTPVKQCAVRSGIPVLQPVLLADPDFVRTLADIRPDIIIVVAFRILPPAVYSLARLGAFNLHASLLPRYRGAAPINWAIINGEKETGVSTFFLEERVDVGTVILQEKTVITDDDDAGSVHDRLAALGARTVVETTRRIADGTAERSPQDSSLASRAPKIFKDDCRIRWDQPAKRVRDFIRGLSPVPAAWTTIAAKSLKIFRTDIIDDREGTPAMLTSDGESIVVQCGTGRLRIRELQLEGRKRVAAEEYLRGYPIHEGDRLA